MVQAGENDPDALLYSLKSGRYYSSQGPELHDASIVNGKIEVRCSPVRRISVRDKGSRADHVDGTAITGAHFDSCPFGNDWFRVTVAGHEDKQGWSNPCWTD